MIVSDSWDTSGRHPTATITLWRTEPISNDTPLHTPNSVVSRRFSDSPPVDASQTISRDNQLPKASEETPTDETVEAELDARNNAVDSDEDEQTAIGSRIDVRTEIIITEIIIISILISHRERWK